MSNSNKPNYENLLNDFLTMADNTKVVHTGLWREMPVDLLTFFTAKTFLNEKPYQGKQTFLLEVVNKVLWWKLTGDKRLCSADLREVTEIVALLGKGSGKDFLVSGILAYVCYIICSLNNPHQYFGFGQDEPIDLINVVDML